MQTNKNCYKRGKEGWVLAFLIIFGFFFMAAAQSVLAQIATIGTEWPKHRCNPFFMPIAALFGHDAKKNSANCMFTTQSGFMAGFLKPLNDLTSVMMSAAGGLADGMNNVRGFGSRLTGSLGSLFGNFFSFFTNTIVAIQKMMIGVQNVIQKIVGIVYVFMYMVNTQMKLGESIVKGPIGKVITFVCFRPNTCVKMKDGSNKKMKNIETGEILFNGQEVIATMKIKGNRHNPFYKIFSKELNEYIYVTGSHHMREPNTGRFIKVSEFDGATKTNEYSEKLSCLVTDNNLIPVGEYTFWDWED